MTRRTRIAAIVVALLVPSVGLAAWYGVTTFPHKGDQLAGILTGYGYTELTPPSRLNGPGALTTVETLSSGAIALRPACKIGDDVLSAMWQRSITLDQRMATNIKQTFNASSDFVDIVKAIASGKRMKNVNVSLVNMNVVAISDEDLMDLRSRYLTGNCEQAIAYNLRNGAKVCQTEEVLQADVVYSLGFEDGLGSSQKLDLAKEFAAAASIDGEVTRTNEVRGDNLYLGVKVRLHCFKLDARTDRVVLAGL